MSLQPTDFTSRYLGPVSVTRFECLIPLSLTEKLLQEDLDEAKRIGAKAVPTWYVNGVELVGARPDGELITAISEALRR